MDNNTSIASLRLPKGPWKANRFSQNPGLIRRRWVRDVLPELLDKESVEVQLLEKNDEWIFGAYPYFSGQKYVKDIGRDWRKKQGLKKPQKGFVTWRKS